MSTSRLRIDYLSEVRQKYNLDKQPTGVKEWERIARSARSSDPTEKKDKLLRISKKIDDEAQHQEKMFLIQQHSKKGKFTMEDAQKREKIDEMYVESVKAKLAIFDQFTRSESQNSHRSPERKTISEHR